MTTMANSSALHAPVASSVAEHLPEAVHSSVRLISRILQRVLLFPAELLPAPHSAAPAIFALRPSPRQPGQIVHSWSGQFQ